MQFTVSMTGPINIVTLDCAERVLHLSIYICWFFCMTRNFCSCQNQATHLVLLSKQEYIYTYFLKPLEMQVHHPANSWSLAVETIANVSGREITMLPRFGLTVTPLDTYTWKHEYSAKLTWGIPWARGAHISTRRDSTQTHTRGLLEGRLLRAVVPLQTSVRCA